jgi:hypothetical protein
MDKPYHLMTDAEKIVARIAANRAIEENVAKGRAPKSETKDFAKLGRAFLDALPDMEKGKEAERLIDMAKKARKK